MGSDIVKKVGSPGMIVMPVGDDDAPDYMGRIKPELS